MLRSSLVTRSFLVALALSAVVLGGCAESTATPSTPSALGHPPATGYRMPQSVEVRDEAVALRTPARSLASRTHETESTRLDRAALR